MKNCINCNLLIEDNKKFCEGCGTKQPEPKSNTPITGEFSATIGDKNIISGNVIGKNEEIKVSGNATFNKIEDDTKKTVICSISGRRLLMIDSIACPSCNKDVAQEYYSPKSNRCLNCDNLALTSYRKQVQIVLSDGILDSNERLTLDSLAMSLHIDEDRKNEIEVEEKQNSKQITSGEFLSGFHKIEFNRALKYVFEEDNIEQGFKLLNNVFLKNSSNDEVANLYYLLEAILLPETAIANYHSRNIDRFWQHYWAFLPHSKKGEVSEAYEIIENNKNLFADKNNDVLISEVTFYLICYFSQGENSYLEEAKSIYAGFSKNVKGPLLPLVKVVDLLIIHSGGDYFDLLQNTDKEEMFILGHIFGLHKVPKNIEIKENKIEVELQIEHHKKTEKLQLDETPISSQIQIEKNELKKNDFNSDDETWVDKDLGLIIKRDKLFFIDARDNNEYPIFFTDSTIWIGRNLAYLKGDFTIDNSNPTASCVYNNLPSENHMIVPKGWYMPALDDWNCLSNFIAVKSGNKQEDIEVSYLSSIHPKIPLVKNFGINYKYANFYIFDNHCDSFSVSKNKENYFMDNGEKLAVRVYIPLNKNIIDKLKELNFLLPDYINYEDIRIIVETKSSIDINNLIIGSSVSCINNKNDDRSTISELEKGSLYTISEINVRKNIITLQEYPQQNNSEKKKWFNISLFNLAVNNNSEKQIEEKITIKKTVIETPKSNKNVIKTNFNEINKTFEIDSLLWSTSFLKTATFRSGKEIPIIEDANEWLAACRDGKPAMCYYLNNPNNHALYNFYAISSVEGLAPKGFKIPGDDEGVEDIDLNFLLNFSLPKGIRQVGTNPQTGKYSNEFVEELMCGTLMDVSFLNEIYDQKDCLGIHVIEWNSNYVDTNNYNGFWGLPVLLIKKNDSKLFDNEDEDYSDLYDVILEDEGISKLAVVKVVKDSTGLDLKEAKELVEKAPSCIKEGLNKAEADAIKIAIEEAGGIVTISNSTKNTTKKSMNEPPLKMEVNSIEKKIEDKVNQTKELLEQEKGEVKNEAQTEEKLKNEEEQISFKEDNEILDLESVCIGSQEWLKKNLNIDKFRNGDIIAESKTIEEWEKSFAEERPSWCYYSFDPKNGEKYGKLYNMFAVHDTRELAPKGWQIPNEEDWKELMEYSGGEKIASLRLKSKKGWNNASGWGLGPDKDGNGINRDGFSAKPGGAFLGKFYNIKDCGYFWSKTIKNPRQQMSFIISANDSASVDVVSPSCVNKGFSVRCVKEKTHDEIEKSAKKMSEEKEVKKLSENVNDNANNVPAKEIVSFPSITIGKQVWMKENLNVDKFLNGDPIEEATYGMEFWTKKRPLWKSVNFDSSTEKIHGKQYNYHAIVDTRGLAPKGWKIPKKSDWMELANYLGGAKIAGKKIKSDSGWNKYGSSLFGKSNGNGTNESNFSAFPSGSVSSDFGVKTKFWCSDKESKSIDFQTLYAIELKNHSEELFYTESGYNEAISIRLLRDL
ncbi:ribosomal protein L7/L12 [Flavobacterium chungnamense]|uniref:Ribosomal protein L7/L12 C-terminal domain-containing protein n=1 Tax=Flavobacterium chungnamense TaxID=706182 RepID=A0ABP7UUJ8_9FLAO